LMLFDDTTHYNDIIIKTTTAVSHSL
jgi:hypothetical protein